MKAIQVKAFGPTENKPSRLKAIAEGVESMTVALDYKENDCGRYNLAKALCIENGWPTELVGRQLPNGDYVFCFKNQ